MDFIKRRSHFIFGVLFFLVGELNGLNAMEVNEDDVVQVDTSNIEENYSESEKDDKSEITKIGCHNYTCKQEVWEDKKKIPEGSYMVISNENLFDKDPMTVYLPLCSSYDEQSWTLQNIRTKKDVSIWKQAVNKTLNDCDPILTGEVRGKLEKELQFYDNFNNGKNVNNGKKITELIEKCTCCSKNLYKRNLNSKLDFICFVPYEEHCAEPSILHFFKNSTERLCRKCMIERLKPHLLKIMNENEITSYERIIRYVGKNCLDLPREHWSPNECMNAYSSSTVYGYAYPTFHLFNYCAPKSPDPLFALISGNYKSGEVIPFINMVEVMTSLLKEVKVPKKEEKKEDKKKNKCVVF